MSVIILLILASLTVGLISLAAFVWSVRSGQYDDTFTPAMRMLLDDEENQIPLPKTGSPAAPFPVSEPNKSRSGSKKN
ncbi:MAG: cbb3-type cytochrome oxidase assembly protein CcoS [Verrucomicrobiota bacterium]